MNQRSFVRNTWVFRSQGFLEMLEEKMKYTYGVSAALALLLPLFGTPSMAQEPLKIGFISTLSGPQGATGEEMLNAYKLALEKTGNTLGGIPVELVVGDDQAKPQVAVQLAREMIQRDGVQLFTGTLQGPVTDAVTSLVTPQGRFVIVPVGASSNLAGEQCNENLFVAGWSTDTMFEAIGEALKGKQNVAVIATNYQAGWDIVAGVKRTYGDALHAELLTTLGQSDFSAEISQIRASGATSLVIFLPGGDGIAFMRQFHQSGLGQSVQVYSAGFQADESLFKAIGDGAVDILTASNWYAALDNPANQAFVTAFRERHDATPSTVAALAYDAVMMMDAALGAVGGDLSDKEALRAALKSTPFASVRGNVSFGPNHYPVQDFYLARVTKADDQKLHSVVTSKIFERRADVHASKCAMGKS